MSIQSEINRISGNVASAYSALAAKGATMPTAQNTNNLSSTVATLPDAPVAMTVAQIRAICV